MRKYFIMVAAAFAFGTTTANELPFQGEFSILSGGTVVGSGELEDGKLKLSLPEGTAGFDGKLVLVGEDGLPIEYQVAVGADGSSRCPSSRTCTGPAQVDWLQMRQSRGRTGH